MNDPHKLPPEQVAALTERLQGALQRRRPRTWLIALSVLVVASAGLALLAWWLRERPVPPRLEVIAFDALTTPAHAPEVVAQLVFPDQGNDAPSLLAGREILFFRAPAQLQTVKNEPQARTVTDAHGRAVVEWTALPAGPPETVVSRYRDAPSRQGSNDQAKLYVWEPGSKILLVDVDETLTHAEPPPWLTTLPAAIAPRRDAATALQEVHRKGYHIAYLTVQPSKAEAYPRVRAWLLGARADSERFPAGPVLGRRDYTIAADPAEARRDRLNDLKARFGEHITFVTRAAVVPGVRTILLEPNAGPPGVARASSWPGVITLLAAAPKD